jgi:hypothetical protein
MHGFVCMAVCAWLCVTVTAWRRRVYESSHLWLQVLQADKMEKLVEYLIKQLLLQVGVHMQAA